MIKKITLFSVCVLMAASFPINSFASTSNSTETNSTQEIISSSTGSTETNSTQEITSSSTRSTETNSTQETTSSSTGSTETNSTQETTSSSTGSTETNSTQETISSSTGSTETSSIQETTSSSTGSTETFKTNNILANNIALSEVNYSIVKSLNTERFIKMIGEQARKVAEENDLYASVMIAQAILESGSGNSSLATVPNYNLFGIKGSYKGQSVLLPTKEYVQANWLTINAAFRKYPSYKESLDDYAKVLKTTSFSSNVYYYSGVWKSNTDSYKDATACLTGRYATDPNYGEKLNVLIETYKLTEYDKPLTLERTNNLQEQTIQRNVLSFLGVPYVWGGTTPNGFDCSGLVQYVFKNSVNIDLPRITTEQEQIGQDVSLSALKIGDLLFWGNRGQTHHVGIYIGNGEFVHAPESNDVVKITKISQFTPNFAKRISKETSE